VIDCLVELFTCLAYKSKSLASLTRANEVDRRFVKRLWIPIKQSIFMCYTRSQSQLNLAIRAFDLVD
jgi:hypothetical protein